MRRLPLVLLPAVVLAGAVFYVAVAAPRLIAHQPRPVSQQPVQFNHRLHVQVAGVDCAFCHRTADRAATAGYPDLQQCMFCHTAAGQGVPEIEKVRQAWVAQQPIEWERVYRLPDHVHFDHQAHAQAGLSCATCHGDVAEMVQVVHARSLNMADCVSCHQQMGAPTQCATCHY